MLLSIVRQINLYLSDYVLVILLLAAGLWYSIQTRWIQVRCFREGMQKVFGNLTLRGRKRKSGMSSFQALATALAAQAGNVIGASGAILTGGPGAIFWMWIIAFFGMPTVYAEAVLAQSSRRRISRGQIQGGPACYIGVAFESAFGRVLAGLFAGATILALGFFGCMTQAHSISATFENLFGIRPWITGAVLAFLCWGISLGGLRRLAAVMEKIVPLVAVFFLFGSAIVLLARIRFLPDTIGMIVRYAFHPDAIVGGSTGVALKTAVIQGIRRGLFSNEVGTGSTPHAHALANVAKPHDQGVAAMIGVLIDTFVILTLNALVILSTLYTPDGLLAGGEIPAEIDQASLTQAAFGSVFGQQAGAIFAAVCLLFFAFSAILSWNLFGRMNALYLFGDGSGTVYAAIALILLFLGTIVSNDLTRELSNLFRQLMAIPNVIALFALTKLVQKAVGEADQQRRRYRR